MGLTAGIPVPCLGEAVIGGVVGAAVNRGFMRESALEGCGLGIAFGTLLGVVNAGADAIVEQIELTQDKKDDDIGEIEL